MSNREIDRKIAELMGYTLSESVPEDYCFLGEDLTHVPDFSSDWNAMRLLVEWLQGMKFVIRLVLRTDGMAQATIMRGDFDDWVVEDTAPLALCEVVLAQPTELFRPKGNESTEPAQAEEGSV